MAAPRHAVFRADASPAIGIGHVMRCLTLADRMAANGWQVTFVTAAQSRAAAPALALSAHKCLILDDNENDSAAAHPPAPADLLVVDHYSLGAAYETACRAWARHILAIDDLPNRPHDCDLLLDQTFGRTADAYAGLIPAHARALAGTDFSLLRPAFLSARPASLTYRDKPRQPQRLLVSLGGSNTDALLHRLLDALDTIPSPCMAEIVAPAAGEDIRNRCAASNGRWIFLDYVDDMAALMSRADLAIGAAGSTSWERCCLGLPTLMTVLAPNQQQIAEALHKAGAAENLGPASALSAGQLAESISGLLHTPDALHDMSLKARSICDGAGADRVVAELEALDER